jgi:hypothetical protein
MRQDYDQDGAAERGSRLGDRSGKTPPALVIIYLIILVWAVLAWIRPGGP